MIPLLIIHADTKVRESAIEKELQTHDVAVGNINQLWFSDTDKLGVEQAKQIQIHLSLKPYQNQLQTVIVVSAHNFSAEAQNALLKTLEELKEKALLIFGTTSENQLLPTLVSRCKVIAIDSGPVFDTEKQKKYAEIFKELTSQVILDWFIFVEKLEEKDEFLYYWQQYYREMLNHYLAENDVEKFTRVKSFLDDLIQAQKWQNSNVNIRPILEYLMFKIPDIK